MKMTLFATLLAFASTTHTAQLVRTDFPIALNNQVISLLQKTSPRNARKLIERAHLYRPTIAAKIKAAGLPKELIAIPAVESNYNPSARSHKNAVGLWQLTPATARALGLQVSDETDERLDPEKETDAALKYLKLLHEATNDWRQVLLSYNAGETATRRALKASNTQDIFKLKMNKESSAYVPKLMAAMILLENPKLLTNTSTYGQR